MPDRGFENLVEDYGRLVLNTAYRILGDRPRAEDVHQEVFLAVWRRWQSYNGDTKWGAYLHKCAVHKSLDYIKKEKKTTPLDASNEPSTTGLSIDKRAVTSEMKDHLRIMIGKMPRRQSEIFVMSRIEGKGYAEIAEALECSIDTVRVHMHRALKQLASEFNKYLYPSE